MCGGQCIAVRCVCKAPPPRRAAWRGGSGWAAHTMRLIALVTLFAAAVAVVDITETAHPPPAAGPYGRPHGSPLVGGVGGGGGGYGSTAGLKATWISTYSCAGSEDQMAACVGALHATGATAVYVDAWHDGKTYYESQTMRDAVGSAGVGSDLVGWALAAAAPLGMEVVAWMEYGLIAAPAGRVSAFSTFAAQAGWVAGEADGFTWMDAGHAGVVRFMQGLATDLRRGYPGLAAVQFDDHFAAPVSLPGSSAAAMTAAAAALARNASRTAGPPLTLAPATLAFALEEYNVDWAAWHAAGYFARFTPQIYRTTAAAFEAELAHTVATLGGTAGLAAGIRGTGTPETAWEELAQMLDACTAAGVGQVVWDVRAVLTAYAPEFKAAWGAVSRIRLRTQPVAREAAAAAAAAA